MNPLRLVFVTKRFWPLTGGVEGILSHLAAELKRQGVPTTIVTAQWERSWPRQLCYRDVPVVRLPHPRGCRWGARRYQRALSQWLRDHRREFDLVLVSGLKQDACTAIDALGQAGIPVILRAEGSGAVGDCRWQETKRAGPRIRQCCKSADALIVPNQTAEQELRGAGYAPHRIHQIAGGVALPGPPTALGRRAARQALGHVHELLAVPEGAPLVVYAGRLLEAMGLDQLVACWPSVAGRWPSARLWLVGEGPFGATLWRRIKRLDLTRQVVLPGSFDELTDVLYAADVFVLPCDQQITSPVLLEAMAAGVPIVASDTAEHRAWITNGQHGLLVPPHDPGALAAAILRVLTDPESAARRGAAARQLVQQRWPLEQVAKQYLEVFRRVRAAKSAEVQS